MSHKLQLEVFEKLIALPGCTVSRTGLVIDEPNADNFRTSFAFLQTIEGCSAWWWGDLINAHAAWNDQQERTDVGQFEATYTAARWAKEINREESTVRQWVRVAAFYPVPARKAELSWAHHQEACDGAAGDAAIAQDWLDKAEKEAWSKTDLRAAIRARARANAEPDEPLPSVRMQEVTSFNRWARVQMNRVGEMDPAWRLQLLTELAPAEKLIASLREFLKK